MQGDTVLGGRYRLEEELGTGGMAVVWRARDEVLGRSVAVKVLNSDSITDPASLARIRREARAAAALSHPHIAQVHDFGVADIDGRPAPYVVMELVPGETVEQRLAAGPVMPREVFQVCAEVAEALSAAHAAGLVHRDIKPANVIMTPAGAKVVDFGIAVSTDPDRSGELSDELFGTPAYIAPERIVDDAVEPASDVYALGVLLYKLLTGRLPWSVEGPTQLLTAHVFTPAAALPALPGVPDQVIDLCHRCLRKDPAGRPTAAEAAAVLAAAAGSRPQAVVPAPPVDRRRRRLLAAAVLTGATAALAVPWTTAHTGKPSVHDAAASRPPVTSRPATNNPAPSTRTTAHTAPPRVAPAPTSAVPLPGTHAPAPASPDTAPSTLLSAAPAPQPRTLSSPGGTVRATCTGTDLAQLLSTTPATSYHLDSEDAGPAPAATAVFRHGNTFVHMTVTCTAGIPSAVTRS